MPNPTPVTVGLDVHARSVRLAAVRADELLEERTLPYDHEAIEKAIGRWPGARACYEAGPTGFGLQRHLAGAGVDCAVVALRHRLPAPWGSNASSGQTMLSFDSGNEA
ncbi:MAG TPA: hypothetical protein VN758_04525 [Solirubrobacterales bacterium]|nr:hypothetical protein [Solirubrobacterales bacterium]